ncbi:MAG: hypothetical protein A3C47_06635 [Omnitrophica bacterium RIFCSPHIGHO2_02_FULL_51_18]|nr:MAG: hypothetical protein A3C47_06635 [Omnitrophica bacterium RIFCSPHIGHO2_02_FULL_51_18]
MIPVTIIYPNDPTSAKVGGVETFLRGFVKYAPSDFSLRYVGITVDRGNYSPGRWHTLRVHGRELPFFPVLAERDENRKTLIPLSLRFTWRLFKKPADLSGSVLLFDRIEPVVAFRKTPGPKIGVIHNDIESQIQTKRSEVLWSRFPAIYFLFEKAVFPHLDAIYTVSEKTLAFYKDRYKTQAGKFAFLPTWVDPEVFSPSDLDKSQIRKTLKHSYPDLNESKAWILFVGRLQEQKAPLRLVETFRAYHKKNPQSILILVGEGNLKQRTQNRARELGLGASVFFLGNKTQAELAQFYRAADVLVLTSNFEGMPRCVLEALGSGLPVVSTLVGEVRRVVRNGFSGEIVEEFSAERIGLAVQKVLDNAPAYSTANCLESVSEYHPKKVLAALYERIRELGTSAA